jgi:hypothetical protein
MDASPLLTRGSKQRNGSPSFAGELFRVTKSPAGSSDVSFSGGHGVVAAMSEPNEPDPNDAGPPLDPLGGPDEIDPEFDPNPFDIDFSDGPKSPDDDALSNRELLVVMRPPSADASDAELASWIDNFVDGLLVGRDRLQRDAEDNEG